MGLRGLLTGAAARARVPVFAVGGTGARDNVQGLRLRHEISVLDTPRPANILLTAGTFTDAGAAALRRVHDQMSPPRLTVQWGPTSLEGLPGEHVLSGDIDELVDTIVGLHDALLHGTLPSEAPVLPDVEPAEWRNVGPYGHGGKGMTGGVPYGRPMAERGPDRDGLQLDRLPVTLGPWLPALPAGLALRVTFQGDIIQEASVGAATVTAAIASPFREALDRPVPIADLELARARHHLRWLAEALRLLGLGAPGLRALRLAEGLTPRDGDAVDAMARAIRRSGAFAWGIGSAGRLEPELTQGLGPVARAGGRPDDARSEDATYRSLGFTPVTFEDGDPRSRWRQRLAEITQSLELITRGRDRTAFGAGVVEGLHGRLEQGAPTPSGRLLELLPALLTGLEWGDAVTCLASLDVDPAEAVAGAPVSGEEDAA